MPCQYGTRAALTCRMVLADESLCKLEGVQSLLEATNRGIRQTDYNAGEQHLPLSIPLPQLSAIHKHVIRDHREVGFPSNAALASISKQAYMAKEKQQSGAHASPYFV